MYSGSIYGAIAAARGETKILRSRYAGIAFGGMRWPSGAAHREAGTVKAAAMLPLLPVEISAAIGPILAETI
jgi:hypothetical protein